MAFHFFPSWHAACSWFRTCQGSRKPQWNKSGACWNQRQLWHLTAFSAQWHHVSKTSSGVSTALLFRDGVWSRVRGHGEDSGWSSAEVWIVCVKNGKILDLMEGFGSRWEERIIWGCWGHCYQDPSICGRRETQLSSRLFMVCKYKNKTKKREKKNCTQRFQYVMFINISARRRWHVCATCA